MRFDKPTRLAGGATMILAADADAFQERYPDGPIAAVYEGELSDRGEKITLRSSTGKSLLSFTYDDENGWPLTADGRGDSLVLTDLTGDMDAARAWQVSPRLYGTPGTGGQVLAAPQPAVSTANDLPSFDPVITQPSNPIDVRFGDDLLLAGYDLYLNGRPLSPDRLPVVQPDDVLEYVLYWRSDRLMGKDYHGFVQLTTPDRQILTQDDRPAGLVLRPTNGCPAPDLVPDRYVLRIPAEAANGLVRPEVGGYVSGTSDRLPVYSAEGTRLDDDYGLPSLKIVRTDPAPRPQQELGARFGDQVELLGYTLDPAEVALHPGESADCNALLPDPGAYRR